MSAQPSPFLAPANSSALTELRNRAAVPLLMLFAVALLFIPLPPAAIDLTVGFNLLIAVALLLATIDTHAVLALQAFPSILLVTTIFRLAVSVSTARGILARGEAGDIVRNFGEFVVGGELIAGLIVFLIISIVQFLVISKGGERIAEVGARFTLDAMPGKQMSIDVDLKNGDITKEEAHRRRKLIERESQFFGSMDGAMRFVKGDSIATMLTVFVSLLGGLAIGAGVHGMPIAEAARKYMILSVGDGLVAQIPSMLSTVAAGILATRVSDEAAQGGLNADITGVIARERRSIAAAAAALCALALVPGFPTAVLLSLGLATLLLVGWSWRRESQRALAKSAAAARDNPGDELPMGAYGDPVVIYANARTLDRLRASGLAKPLIAATQRRATEMGIGVSLVKFREKADAADDCATLFVEGGEVDCFELKPQIDAGELAEAISRRSAAAAATSIGVDEVEQWLTLHARNMPKLIESARQQLPTMLLVEVVRRLIEEGVKLDQPRAMLTAMITNVQQRFTPEEMLEDARVALARQIVQPHLNGLGELEVMRFDDATEAMLANAAQDPQNVASFDEHERDFAALIATLKAKTAEIRARAPRAVMVVGDLRRGELRQRLAAQGVLTPVLSRTEAAAAPVHKPVD